MSLREMQYLETDGPDPAAGRFAGVEARIVSTDPVAKQFRWACEFHAPGTSGRRRYGNWETDLREARQRGKEHDDQGYCRDEHAATYRKAQDAEPEETLPADEVVDIRANQEYDPPGWILTCSHHPLWRESRYGGDCQPVDNLLAALRAHRDQEHGGEGRVQLTQTYVAPEHRAPRSNVTAERLLTELGRRARPPVCGNGFATGGVIRSAEQHRADGRREALAEVRRRATLIDHARNLGADEPAVLLALRDVERDVSGG